MQRDREQKEKAENPLKPLKKQRLPSYENMLALDHVISCVVEGSSLETFLPKKDDDDLPMCERPTLVIQSDCGSDLMAVHNFAGYHLGLRYWFVNDVRHMLVNEQMNACKQAGLSSSMALADIVLTFLQGPWGGHKWMQIVREETKEFMQMASSLGSSSAGALLRHFSPQIAVEQGWERASPNDVFSALRSANFLCRKGVTTTSRWDSFHRGFRDRKKEFTLLLMILVSYGIRAGYVLNPEKLTLQEMKKVSTSVGAAEAETLKDAKKKKSFLYDSCRNKLHVATVCMGNQSLMEDLRVWYWCSKPIADQLNSLRQQLHGRTEPRNHMKDAAIGGCSLQVVEALLTVPAQTEVLEDLGFSLKHNTAGAVRCKKVDVEAPHVFVEDVLMQKVVKTLLCLVHFKLFNLSLSMYSYPARFAALLDDDEHRRECLLEMQSLDEAFEEVQNLKNKGWRTVCHRSPLRLTVVREVFAHLKQSAWKVSEDLCLFLQQSCMHFGATYNEEAFGEMRAAEKTDGKAAKMSSIEVWSTASRGGIMKRFGYREVEAPAADLAPSIPDSLFHTQLKQPSMPKMCELTGRGTPWPTLQPLVAPTVAAELWTMVTLRKAGKLDQLTASWRTQFLLSGLIVKQKGQKDWFMSTGPWPKGSATLLLPMQRKELKKGLYAFGLKPNLSRGCLRWASVFQFDTWEVAQTKVVSPIHFGVLLAKGSSLNIPDENLFFWLETDKPRPLLQHCAHNAFFDISADILELLLQAPICALVVDVGFPGLFINALEYTQQVGLGLRTCFFQCRTAGGIWSEPGSHDRRRSVGRGARALHPGILGHHSEGSRQYSGRQPPSAGS